MAQSSKNNPAARVATSSKNQVLKSPETCHVCGGELKTLGERVAVMVSVNGKKRMKRQHKDACPKAA